MLFPSSPTLLKQPFSRLSWMGVILAGSTICTCVAALGQEASTKPIFTQPPTDDVSFNFQGEFLGEIQGSAETDASAESEEKKDQATTLGIQIRVVGAENFEGLSYVGGLPGKDTQPGQPMKLIGRRSGEFLVLSGGPWAIFVDKTGCNLIDKSGKSLGRLERVQRSSSTMGAKPPAEAIVLFDGSGTEQFAQGKMTEDGLLEEGANIKAMIQDFDLHVEFQLPYMPFQEGQSRANSGVYIMSRYECQILDSFAQLAVNNGCGSIYQFKAPDINMCLPPLEWQTYDIRFTAPRWSSDGSKIRNAHISSWLNGVKVQNEVDVPHQTGHGKPEQPSLLPTLLQNHDCPVRFRNAWIVDRGLLASDSFPPPGNALAVSADSTQDTSTPTIPTSTPASTEKPAESQPSEGN